MRHDEERYEVHLCKDCFIQALANLRQDHRLQNMSAEGYQPADHDTFGVVAGNQKLF